MGETGGRHLVGVKFCRRDVLEGGGTTVALQALRGTTRRASAFCKSKARRVVTIVVRLCQCRYGQGRSMVVVHE